MPPADAADVLVPRRSFLVSGGAAAALMALTGCGLRPSDVRLDDVPTPTPPVLAPDDLARFAAIERLTALRELAEAVVAASPTPTAVADLAAAAAADHVAHLDQLGPLPGPVPTPSATPQGWPTAGPPPVPGPPTPAVLATTENACAVDLLGRTGETSGELARLLASIATSGGARAVALASLAAAPAPVLVPGTGAELLAEPSEDLMGSLQPSDRQALEGLVGAHHAAAYAFGVLAVRLDGTPRDRAVASIVRHSGDANALSAAAARAGADLPPAAPAYRLPVLTDAAAAETLASRLELDVADAAAALVPTDVAGLRTVATERLVAAGLQAAAWGPLPAFPGMPELA